MAFEQFKAPSLKEEEELKSGLRTDTREEQAARTSHQVRAPETRDRTLANNKAPTAKDAEARRSEYYQRAADQLNNAAYWRPGSTIALAGQAVQGQTSQPYQMSQIETEDMRQQGLNRELHGQQREFDQFGRYQDANNIMYKVDMGGEMTLNDIERLNMVNDESLRQLLGVNREELYDTWRHMPQEFEAALQKAAAAMKISDNTIAYIFQNYINRGDYEGAMMWAMNMGVDFASLGENFGQWFRDLFPRSSRSYGTESSAPGPSANTRSGS